ncbi:MAG: DnaJ domain-containing protein [Limisphaerales bacterium]
MQTSLPNYYALLGLDHDCTIEQIRAAYRLFAKQLHPDLNSSSSEAVKRTQEINAAYEILSNPEQRSNYDEARKVERPASKSKNSGKIERNISQEIYLRIEEFFRGATLEVRLQDSGNPDGTEIYPLRIPPATAPGSKFCVSREGYFQGGFILVRVRARPDFRFKVRGSDLRCDLRVSSERAAKGGSEMVQGAINKIRVEIPPRVARNEIIRVAGEGLPKARGGRGDLLVRITYRPEVRISRASNR